MSKLAPFSVTPASLSSLPPWLSSAAWLVSASAPALEKVPPRLSRRAARAVRLPSLTSAPPWLSSTPPRLTLRLFWLSSRPPSPLNSSPPSRLRPSRPASTPLAWFSRRCTVRRRPLSPMTLPPRLSSCSRAFTATFEVLEISPARLSTCRASIAMPPFAAISPDWLLSSVSAATFRVFSLTSSPPCWARLPSVACRSPLAAIRPPALPTAFAARSRRPSLSSLPPWSLRRLATSTRTPALPLALPPSRLSKAPPVALRPASATSTPPRLSRLAPWTFNSLRLDSRPPARLSSCPTVTRCAPWLSRLPSSRLSSRPPRLTSRPPRLLSVPLPLLSRLRARRSRRLAAENKPRRLSMAPLATTSRSSPISLPPRLSRLPTRASTRLPETSPSPRLSSAWALTRVDCWLPSRPCWPLSSVAAPTSRSFRPITWPPRLSRSPRVLTTARSRLCNRPSWRLSRLLASTRSSPSASSLPPRLSRCPASTRTVAPFRLPPWLSSAWLAFASSARLATRLPALRRVPLRSSRSPRALRRSSGSTPASITPALSICAASSAMRSRAARLCRLTSSSALRISALPPA
ncbi:Uncharacterised protein [Pseudomonas aeruginosa]|nr:Uncharacterised protein [Pseudomonas aeruginosa]